MKDDIMPFIILTAIIFLALGIVALAKHDSRNMTSMRFKNCNKTAVTITGPDGGIEDNSYWTCK